MEGPYVGEGRAMGIDGMGYGAEVWRYFWWRLAISGLHGAGAYGLQTRHTLGTRGMVELELTNEQ